MKTCSRCGETKPLDAFCVDRSMKSGRTSACKKCRLEQRKRWEENNPEHHLALRRRHYNKHRDRLLAEKKARRDADPEAARAAERRYYENNRNKLLEKARRYYWTHREEVLAYHAQYREERPGESAARMRRWREDNPDAARAWREANPDKIQEYNQRHYALRRGAPNAKRILMDEVILRDLGRCGLCGQPVMGRLSPEGYVTPDYPTLDHITPVTKGGLHVMENVQLAHARCNSSKRDRLAAA